jgi:hypothetical protein
MRLEPTKLFEQQVKRLTKKYPSLAQEVPAALIPLANNQLESFDAMPKGFYKIRVPIASKGVGKRGGARIIAHVRIVEDKAYLVSIYDKADYDNVSDDVLKEFMRDYKPPQ